MNRCAITYEECEGKYSPEGLKLLSRNLSDLKDIDYSAEEQRHQAAMRAVKMSIQGMQPKLSAVLDTKQFRFKIVDINGKYIIKPQHHIYPQLPENEDLTMKMAKKYGISIPVHGMVYSKDGTLSYFIERFDRVGRSDKRQVEDFAQIAGEKRDTKYNYSIEKLIGLIEEYCTFPQLDKLRFFKRFLFNYLVGNEDMHLKNYSLISYDDKVEFSPAYDFLNSTIVAGKNAEESALTLKGKKSNLTKEVLIDYLGAERLKLNEKVIKKTLNELRNAIPSWYRLIEVSFLNPKLKDVYSDLLETRINRLKL